MSGHLTGETRERYRQRRLTPAELFAVDDHLAGCEACRLDLSRGEATAFAALRREVEAPAAGEEPLHLSEEQMAAYLERRLDEVDREIIEGHLEGCDRCALEVRELRAFHALLSTHPVREYAPPEQVSLLARLRGLFTGPLAVLPVGALGAAAAAAILLVAVVRPLNTELAAERGRGRDLERQNNALLQRSASAGDLEAERARLRDEAARAQREVAQLREQNAVLAQENQDLSTRPSVPGTRPARPGPGSRPTRLALSDGGGELTRDAGGDLVRTERLPEGVDRALRTGRVAKPMVLAMLVEPGGVVRGTADDGKFAVRGPQGAVVRSDRPTFTWTSRPVATTYQVAVYDADFNEVAASGPVQGTSWTPSRPLPRGKVLQWQVVALKGEDELDRAPQPPAPAAKLQVLSADRAAALESAERRFTGSHLTLGVLYAEAGLLDDAERELRALLRENPDSETARKLLRSVEGLRGGK